MVTRASALLLVVTLGPGPGAVGAERVAVERVRMVDDAYRPRVVTVPRGTRVRWTNGGQATHSSTSTDGVWNSGLLDPGETFSRVFRRAGTFAYRCTLHQSMRGRVVVT